MMFSPLSQIITQLHWLRGMGPQSAVQSVFEQQYITKLDFYF